MKGVLFREYSQAMDKVSAEGLYMWLNWLGVGKGDGEEKNEDGV